MSTGMATAAETSPEQVPPDGETARGSVVLAGISKYYGDQLAVDGLSLTVQPGEFISLLGPSGCGKTTTLRMIAGFEQPDAGDIRISRWPRTSPTGCSSAARRSRRCGSV